ncbi:MAG TPA: dihydroorotase [Cytophagaceae bacterium]|jgi:dihydroorotase|nr:dihydroorotase [Cytophagaceae bacterium]
MKSILILNANIVNEGRIYESDVLVEHGRISKIEKNLSSAKADTIIEAKGKYLFPGVIDDQVHFREPGLTHKATIYTESKAAVAGGVTSFMEMPNTVPNALTQELLKTKYEIGAHTSLANYSFFMGVSNDNYDEVMKTNGQDVCGLKIFMGSSTGNMLVDNISTLEKIFRDANLLIATHCEDEETIRTNASLYKEKYGDQVPPYCHPEIRTVEACFKSSSLAVKLAQKYNTRLHILHISTEEELELFKNNLPLKDKRITSEVCIHHLWFDKNDYKLLGNLIKWNPAVKEARHKEALFKALLDNRLDIIATDHAPHTWEEKQQGYWQAPSGGPLIQHYLNVMLEFYYQGKIGLEKIVEKMCHAPADCFQLKERGYIREGYHADIVLVDLNKSWIVKKENILYKCGWSAFEGKTFQSSISHTLVSGHLAYSEGKFDEQVKGQRLLFNRE